MNFVEQVNRKWQRFYKKHKPACDKICRSASKASDKILISWDRIAKYKKIILAVPVAASALIMAMVNMFSLPALVGFGLQSDGAYSFEIIREVAVLGPLLISAICLLLLLASKRTLTPWMVSVASLLLPLFILFTNTFPF